MYNDIKNQASIIGVNASLIETIDTKYLTWSRESYNDSTSEVHVMVSGTNETLIGNGGVINLKVRDIYNMHNKFHEIGLLIQFGFVFQYSCNAMASRIMIRLHRIYCIPLM